MPINAGYIVFTFKIFKRTPKESRMVEATGTKLLLKLSNILNFESLFSGFSFMVPSAIIIFLLSHPQKLPISSNPPNHSC